MKKRKFKTESSPVWKYRFMARKRII